MGSTMVGQMEQSGVNEQTQETRYYAFFCRSCGNGLATGEARCSCGRNVISGLPWPLCVTLGMLIALLAYPAMITVWMYGLNNLVAEFAPRAALAIVISTAILGPVFAVTMPLAKAARIFVGPVGADTRFRAKLRMFDDAWHSGKRLAIVDVVDYIDESSRAPFLCSLASEFQLPVFVDVLTNVNWGTVASCDTRDKDTRVVRAAINALVLIGDQSLITAIESGVSEALSGDELDIARVALANQKRRIEEGDVSFE